MKLPIGLQRGVLAGLLAGMGGATLFLLRILRSLPLIALRPGLVVRQVYLVGVLSLVIIMISGLFVGMVLALQGYNNLVRFGAEESLGVIVALSLMRELGPVVAALLFAGRSGSAVAAEIGLMKATDQLSAMEMMAVDPIHRVVGPRFLAGLISLPLLVAIFTTLGILGGYVIGVQLLGVDAGSYWGQIESAASFREDVLSGIIKSVVFGLLISWIAVFQGYTATPTAEGVSRATTQTVVISSLAVLALDFVLTGLMFSGD